MIKPGTFTWMVYFNPHIDNKLEVRKLNKSPKGTKELESGKTWD